MHKKLELEGVVLVPLNYDKAAAEFAGESFLVCPQISEESERALVFPKDERKGEERKEEDAEEEEQERKEEEKEKEKGVLAPALVILQQMAERSLQSSDVQLEGNQVGRDMVNILAQGFDGRHLSMKIARYLGLCTLRGSREENRHSAGCLLFDSAGKGSANRGRALVREE